MTHLKAKDMEVRTAPLQDVKDLVKQFHVPFGAETHWGTPETIARLATGGENIKEGT